MNGGYNLMQGSTVLPSRTLSAIEMRGIRSKQRKIDT
jgi:hypothetical protein